ncbi:MAG: molecular chaperone DnaJ [Pleurocapsa sp.]
MNLTEILNQIKSQLEQINAQEQANQQEQAQINQRIEQLEVEIKQQLQRRSELDQEAIQLYSQAEELKPKLNKLQKILNLSQQFQELEAECQDNQELLNTLYSSISNLKILEVSGDLNNDIGNNNYNTTEYNNETSTNLNFSKTNNFDPQYTISIDAIKNALPNADKIYQHLLAGYLEEYQTYQNYIVDGLDLIWYSVGFIAFGRDSYRKMSFKYHPDRQPGSDRAMQLINTAWEISQQYLAGETHKL